jgi:hypothetical protein
MGGLKCRACRRFIWRRWHFVLFAMFAIVAVFGLIELIARLTPPPLSK